MSASHSQLVESACAELFVDGNLSRIPSLFSSRYVAHLTDGAQLAGHKAIHAVIALYRKAFAGMECDVKILVANRDCIAWQRTLRAVHVAPLRGFPATDKKVVWREMITSRIENGLIAEEWVVTELVERLILARKGARKDTKAPSKSKKRTAPGPGRVRAPRALIR